jgi:hypothetical protein
VLKEPSGQPKIQLTGECLRIASEQGIAHWHVSISHIETHATASAIGLRGRTDHDHATRFSSRQRRSGCGACLCERFTSRRPKRGAGNTQGEQRRDLQPKDSLHRRSPPRRRIRTFAAMMTKEMSDATINGKAEVLKAFYNAGGRLVDTAPSYDNAEEVIGVTSTKLGLNDKIFITTKILERGGGAEAGITSFERSFQRLQRDKSTKKIEVMQCHNFIEWDVHLPTMRKWKDDGKFPLHRRPRITRTTRTRSSSESSSANKVDFLQINYSVPEPQAAEQLLAGGEGSWDGGADQPPVRRRRCRAQGATKTAAGFLQSVRVKLGAGDAQVRPRQ